MKAIFLACGVVFGFLLSRSRVTDYDTMIRFFRLSDLHVAGVMGVAIAVAAVGLRLLDRSRAKSLAGGPIEIPSKPMRSGVFPAGALFGAGWAFTGTWPGTALAQLGELKLYALFTLAGILGGTFTFGSKPR